ncbi:pyridoxamine 5'-phosphate oxidase family protein [Parashewanella hymeniacidonis]|uniref:pyridoxamine 5'-phosphate oxidase family protein n=1 Tax=Parashewanella hymeniacidonis TaxID=2807618 RepID=UPI001961BFA3|nr:pyridoxamine 5'-phosphate oxidase family protein [Parashewanella hymeniacidonis]
MFPLLFITVLSVSAEAQNTHSNNFEVVAQSIIQDSVYGSLVSIDKSGYPKSRTVKFSQPNDDFVIWVATKPNTRKVSEINANPKVQFHFIADDYKSYLSIIGKARLHSELETIHQHDFFEPKLRKKLWPDFPKDYVLIRIEPIRVEMLGRKIYPNRVNWKPQHLCLQSNHDVCR